MLRATALYMFFCRQEVRIGIVITLRRLEFQGQEHSFSRYVLAKAGIQRKILKSRNRAIEMLMQKFFPNLSQIRRLFFFYVHRSYQGRTTS